MAASSGETKVACADGMSVELNAVAYGTDTDGAADGGAGAGAEGGVNGGAGADDD